MILAKIHRTSFMKRSLPIITTLALCLFSSCLSTRPISVYTIGDSTMAKKQKDKRPETGWAEMLPMYLDKSVKVYNHGLNGRSTKSFIHEGEWDKVLKSLKKGDYVLIQFGHNDEKKEDSTRYTNPFTSYQANLRKFIEESRSKKAIPILLTSISRRSFNEKGVLINSHGEYPQAVHELARETNTLFIDALLLTEQLLNSCGPDSAKKLFMYLEPGENPNCPDGKKDDTHLNNEGAKQIAKLIASEIKRLNTSLAKRIK